MEGEEFKYWINRFTTMIQKEEVTFNHTGSEFMWNYEFGWTEIPENLQWEVKDFIDDMYFKNKYVKHMSPEVSRNSKTTMISDNMFH